jgi:hypothetical protein
LDRDQRDPSWYSVETHPDHDAVIALVGKAPRRRGFTMQLAMLAGFATSYPVNW